MLSGPPPALAAVDERLARIGRHRDDRAAPARSGRRGRPTTGRPSRAARGRPAAGSLTGCRPRDRRRRTARASRRCATGAGAPRPATGARRAPAPRPTSGPGSSARGCRPATGRCASRRRARGSPVLSGASSSTDAVVAMPRRSWLPATSRARRRLARWKAPLSRLPSTPSPRSKANGQVLWRSESTVSPTNASMASTAMRDATSPATWPPMPSATTNRPRSGRVQ